MAHGNGTSRSTSDSSSPSYLILDTESVPDGCLLNRVKYPGDGLDSDEAIRRAQNEARVRSNDASDFVPVTFQYPVSVCVARVGADFRLQAVTCLDAPQFRPREMTEGFWKGLARYHPARLVTFNGRGFDLPLLELAAFRYGCCTGIHYEQARDRYRGQHLDLFEWFTNKGAYRFTGGLNLLAKMLGKPGKSGIAGDQVYSYYQAGRVQEINDYCLADTLDTYFVFLRTRVLTGEITIAQEHEIVAASKTWLTERAADTPGIKNYLDNWGDWNPWP